MRDKRYVVYLVLIMLPVAFLLFLLATINVLFLLLGIILLLIGLIILKRFRPNWFRRAGKPKSKRPLDATTGRTYSEKPQVFMVLAGREDFGARRITVNKNIYTVGRDKDCDFPIDNPRISRHHLSIEYNPKERACYVIDAGSKNGTFVNSQRLKWGERRRLRQGDQVMIDDCAFVVEYAHY